MLIVKASFSKYFTEHMPGSFFFFFFPLKGPTWAIYFNRLSIKQNTSSKPEKDVFTPFCSIFCLVQGSTACEQVPHTYEAYLCTI